MEFVEGSRGIYRPIRVLFDTPIYDRALQICWNIKSYKGQVALMMELLSLQQKNQIPSWVTTEDMIQLILEKSKSTLRERLWEFELQDFDEDEAKPLLTLLWAVNVSNKMRDVEFEARMLLKSPEAAPPNFRHRTILNMAQNYAKILCDLEAPGSKLLCPGEVVLEVVPRVLQGFWVLPPRALLNMPSQLLSKLSVGVAKATLDRVCHVLTAVGHQADCSRSIRDDIVLSVQTEIRQTWTHDVLVSSIKNFCPALLTEIADVASRHICEMFQPRTSEVATLLTPEVETPEEQQISNPETNSAEVEGSPSPTAEPAANIQAKEDGGAESSPDLDHQPSSEPDTATLTNLLSSPAEPLIQDQAREDGSEEASLEIDNSTELDTATVMKPLLPQPVEATATDEAREDSSRDPSPETAPQITTAPDSVVVTPPATPASEVQVIEELLEEQFQEKEPQVTTAPDTVVVTPPATPASEVQVIEELLEEQFQEKEPQVTTAPDTVVVQKVNMEFVEGSRGIYRPIRVLFDTPIYDRALQICWNIKSYKGQVALMMELLSLQQKNQIPSWVTTEDMIQLILEKSKSTLRERLWEFELQDFDEDEAKPLLTLLWAVNVSNKMRDVEFEARMLLKSPEAAPPNFRHRTILNMAQNYAKILCDLEAPGSKLLCPGEVVLEVVPRVLQGFWVLPPRALLNMPSQLLSKLSVGVAKATLDRVCHVLTNVGHQADCSRSIRDDMVLSIQTEIRQTWTHDVLVSSIKNFSPALLTEIADVASRHICEMFQPRSSEVATLLTPEVETHEEQQISNPETNSAEVEGSPSPTAEPAANIQAKEDGGAESSLDLDHQPSSEPDTATLTNLLSSPAEPLTQDQAREDGSEEASLEIDNSTELDTATVMKPLLPQPVEATATDEAREDSSRDPSPETAPQITTAPDSVVVTPPATPASEVQVIEELLEEQFQEKEPEASSEPNTRVPLEPVVIVMKHSTVNLSVRGRVRRFLNRLRPLLCCFPQQNQTD